MSSKAIFSKVADVAHRGVVLGLMGWFGYLSYQTISNVTEGRSTKVEEMSQQYWKDVNKAVKEDYEQSSSIDSEKSRDWYDEDDDSYLKNRVRPKMPPQK